MNSTKPLSEPCAHNYEDLRWIFYDGDCPICAGLVARFENPLGRRGYSFTTLRSIYAQQVLQISPDSALTEMKLRTEKGEVLGGAEALFCIARGFWWGRPLALLGRNDLILSGAQRIYRWIAVRRHCLTGSCRIGGLR